MSHSIGTLRFAPDGSLFVGNGDGADFTVLDPRALRSLDLDSLSGRIMRIHPISGDGYADNPFWDGDPASNRSKTWNYGLRNPFRFGLHPTTAEPFIGDVGWNGWEELDTGKGANFGWPCYEGNDSGSQQQGTYANEQVCQDLYALGQGAVEPGFHSYAHSGGAGNSVIGGDFYTGATYPPAYQDAFFFGDFSMATIEYLTFDGSGNVTGVSTFGTGAPLVALLRGPDTNLYYVDVVNEEVRTIRYNAGGNTPPTAVAGAVPTSGPDPLAVEFVGDESFDPDGDELTYDWDFGDGGSSADPNPTHNYATAGIYTAILTVTDTASATSTHSVAITAGNTAPTAAISAPLNGSPYRLGDNIVFSGTGNDPETGSLPASSFEWTVNLHHSAHLHFDVFAASGLATGAFQATDHGDDSHLEVCLTVTDPIGLESTDCVEIFPETVTYAIDSVPAGHTLSYSGVSGVTPFTVETQIDGVRTVSAPPNAGAQVFDVWSDGGAISHDITVLDTPQTLTATYAPVACGPLVQEAEDGTLFGDFAIGTDPAASNGQYVSYSSDPIWSGPDATQRASF